MDDDIVIKRYMGRCKCKCKCPQMVMFDGCWDKPLELKDKMCFWCTIMYCDKMNKK